MPHKSVPPPKVTDMMTPEQTSMWPTIGLAIYLPKNWKVVLLKSNDLNDPMGASLFYILGSRLAKLHSETLSQ